MKAWMSDVEACARLGVGAIRPALAITMSRALILCVVFNVSMPDVMVAADAISMFTTMMRDPEALGREDREASALATSRTVATTVVSGTARYASTKALPNPG